MSGITVAASIDSSGAATGAASFTASLASMRAGVAQTGAAISAMGSQTTAALSGVGRAASGMGAAVGNASVFAGEAMAHLGTGVSAVAGLFSRHLVLAAAAAAASIVHLGDNFVMLKARLDNVGGEGGAGTPAVMDALKDAAMRARAPIDELSRAYAKNANAFSDMKLSQADGIKIMETLSKVTTISGNSTKENAAAMMQLSQAFASGKLQGDEFRSISENMPELMRIMQRETGKTAGELRKLSKEGKITGETIAFSLLKASEDIDAKFAKMPQTVENAISQAASIASRQWGEAMTNAGVGTAIVELINTWTKLSGGAFQKFVAEGFSAAVTGAKDLTLTLAETRLTTLAFFEAIGQTEAWKIARIGIYGLIDDVGYLIDSIKFIVKALPTTAWNGFSRMIDADLAKNIDSFRAARVAVEQFRGTLQDKGDIGTADTSRKVTLGKGDPKQGPLDNLKKQIEAQQFQGKIFQAEIDGNDSLVISLRSQLEIRNRISEAMRRESPELAKQLEAEIKRTNELQIQNAARGVTKQIDNERLKGELELAAIEADPIRAQAIHNELAVRGAISEEMRRQHPVLAEQLAGQIRLTAELARQKAEHEKLKTVGEQFGTVITDSIMAGAKAGESFSKTLKNLMVQLIEMTVRLMLIKPLLAGASQGFADAFKGTAAGNVMAGNPNGGENGGLSAMFSSGSGSGGEAASTGGWEATVTPGATFANGGIFDSPVRFSSGGMSGQMGEAGPEAIMPLSRGADGRLGVASGGASAAPITVQFNVSGDATQETLAKMRAMAEDVFGQRAPGIVAASVQKVASTHRSDPGYLRR